MKSFWTWSKNKLGRIVSLVGILLSGVETLDISVIKDPLEGIVGHKGVMWITVTLFIASFWRHQWVANQHPSGPPLPNPAPGTIR